MNHPDFRINGKIFATLGVPDEGCAPATVGELESPCLALC
jgi:hypothetical protein